MSWQIEMPLLTSRFFLYDLAKVIFLSGGIFYLILLAILLFSAGMEHIGQMTAVMALVVGGIGWLFVLIALVFFGNRWPMAFLVSAAGVGWQSLSRRGKRANRLAILVGALSGKPGMAGAGLLAASNEQGFLQWQNVGRLKAYPELRILNVLNSWRTVVRLYCTPENFSAVLASVEQYSGLRAEYPNQNQLPQNGRPPIALIELLRRVALVVCVCVAGWKALLSPAVLIQAERADFAAEYKSEFAPPEAQPPDSADEGEPLIARDRDRTTLDEYIAETTDHRLLTRDDDRWPGFLAALPGDGRWMSLDDQALAGIRGGLREIFAQTQWSVIYLPVIAAGKTSYIEFHYDTSPRTSKAPVSLIYPERRLAWLWCLAGIAIYALLPWAKNSAWMVTYDRVCIVALDLIAVLMVGFFFALPLYASSSTDEALGGDFGMTVFLWCIAACGTPILIWSTRCAAFALIVEQGQFRIGRLTGSRVCPFAEITSAETIEHNGSWTGVKIECRSGVAYKLAYGPLCRFERLLDGLRLAGVPLRRNSI